MTSRLSAFCIAVSSLLLAQGENLLPNPGFEEVAENQPVGWKSETFRTGGVATSEAANPHGGKRCVALRSRDDTERIAWRGRGNLPEGTMFVAAGGWYRTEDVAAGSKQGATLRVHFHGKRDGKMRELALRQVFFAPSADWRQTEEQYFPVPAGTEQVELQVFNWLTPGKTYWDDVWLKPIRGEDLDAMMPKLAEIVGVDREPTLGRNLPYSPADGETVSINPPPFRWVPAKNVNYDFELSRNADFAGDVIRRTDYPWCAEMLTEPLAAGTWHWRYGARVTDNQTVWSKARRFVVPTKAEFWAYPKPEQFEVTKQRPRLFVAPGKLAEYRLRAKDGDLKSAADSLVRGVPKWEKEELVAEPEWLPEGKDRGAAYTVTFWTTRGPMDRMEHAALAYLLTGDAAAGAEAKRRILHFFSWDPHGPTNVFHNDEPAMWVMMRGSRAYDWTYDLFTAEERQKVETCMLERGRDFYKKLRSMPFDNNPFESHAGRIIGFLGEAAISLAPEHEEARMWLDYITKIYWGVYPAWGKQDGGWNEGPHYWEAYMSFGLHYVVALREATGIDLSQRPFFRNTPYYRLYLTLPFSRMAPFGDGTQFRPNPAGPLMYWFSTLSQDPRIRWYADYLGKDGGSSILGVVLKDDALQSLPPFDLPLARHFEGVGMATLHTDLTDAENDVFLAMRSTPYGAVSHGHNDQNCFALEAYGEPLAVATGHYNRYGSPHHDGWTRQTKAKCGITIDGGKGQDRGWNARGRITDYLHGDGFDWVRGDATEAYGGRLGKAVREVVHVRPGLFVVRDELMDDEPHVYEYWLHALDEMKIEAETGTVRIERPKASLTVRFLSPEKPTLTQTDAFDPPPVWPAGREFVNNWHLTAATPEPTESTEFLTVLLPAKAGAEKALPAVARWQEGSAHGVRLSWPDGRTTVVGFGTKRSVFDGIETDARTFAVTRDAKGAVTDWLAGGATGLRVGGVDLLSLAANTRGEGRPGMSSTPMPILATGSFDETYGRIDADWRGNTHVARMSVPKRYRAATRETVPLAFDGTGLLQLDPSAPSQSVDLWTGEPGIAGEIGLKLVAGDRTAMLRGLRNRRGEALVEGKLDLAPGVYRLDLPAGVHATGLPPVERGTLWLNGSERVSFRGSLPEKLSIVPIRLAAPLRPVSRAELPTGIHFEAESNWRETGGKIRLSQGGHANTSGNDCLWAWNTPGHAVEWTLDVPKDGDYELWFVGATECGMVGGLQVNGSDVLPVVFKPTGGWGRERANEWQAYRVLSASGQPVRFSLATGKNRISLTNRSGMGLNVDELVLVAQ